MMGDINSRLAAADGPRQCRRLVSRYGIRNIPPHSTSSGSSRKQARDPRYSGIYMAEATLDGQSGRCRCKVTVIVKDDEMTIDSARKRSTMNSGRSGGGGPAQLSLSAVTRGDAVFRPLKLVLPEGTIVSAGPTSPMGAYNSALPMLIDLVIRALGPAMPDRAAAAHYGTFCTLAYAGRHPDTGLLWQCHDSGFGGWGALHDMDGPGPFRTNCHGDTRLIPIETR
jgi:N-methylhydantoinase B